MKRVLEVFAGVMFIIGFMSLIGTAGWTEYMDEIGEVYSTIEFAKRIVLSLLLMALPIVVLGGNHD